MFRKFLIVLVVLVLGPALVVTLQNDCLYRRNRSVEITVDHREIQHIIRQTGTDEGSYLHRLRELGVTSIALREDDLAWLEETGSLLCRSGRELLWQHRLFNGADGASGDLPLSAGPGGPEDSTCLLVFEETLAQRLRNNIALKLGQNIPLHTAGGAYLLPVDFYLDPELRVGVDLAAARRYREQGFHLVARPDNSFLSTPEAAETVLRRFLAIEGVSAIIFDGPAVTGYPHYLEQTAAGLEQSGLPLGVIKYTVPQAGLAPLAARLGYPTVLVHSNYSQVPPVLISGSVVEDNIRLLYVHFDLAADNLAAEAERVLAPVQQNLLRQGYTFGPAVPAAAAALAPPLFFLVAAGGCLAPALLLLSLLFPLGARRLPLLFGLGCLALVGALRLLPIPTLARLASLSAAALFPALAVVSQQLNPVRPLWTGGALGSFFPRPAVGALLRTTAISLAGGVIAAALCSQPYFLSGTAVYRGIKLAYLLPLGIIIVQALTVIGAGERYWRGGALFNLARQAWTKKLQPRHLVFLLLGAAMLYFYVMRSGHSEGMTYWLEEIRLRNFFREMLSVRPRLKELLGHPLALAGLCLVAWRAAPRRRLLTFFALVGGAIGQVSLVNSFCHWTAPLSVSLLRTLHGLWIGLICGALAAILLRAVIVCPDQHGRPEPPPCSFGGTGSTGRPTYPPTEQEKKEYPI